MSSAVDRWVDRLVEQTGVRVSWNAAATMLIIAGVESLAGENVKALTPWMEPKPSHYPRRPPRQLEAPQLEAAQP